MRHNTVVLSWPNDWKAEQEWVVANKFVSAIRAISAAKCAIMVPKYAEKFPANGTKVSGFIDVW